MDVLPWIKQQLKQDIQEGPHPNEQPGSVSSCPVETNEGRKKANALPLKNEVISPTYLIALVVAVVLLIAASIAIITAFVEISKLRSEVVKISKLRSEVVEISKLRSEVAVLPALENSVDVRLTGIEILVNNSELNDEIHFQNISNSISIQQKVINQLSSDLKNNFRIITNFATIIGKDHVLSSCAAIHKFFPFQPSSGYYKIRSSNGSAITAYCDMTRSCGGITGGWMRVAELDMTDTFCVERFMLNLHRDKAMFFTSPTREKLQTRFLASLPPKQTYFFV